MNNDSLEAVLHSAGEFVLFLENTWVGKTPGGRSITCTGGVCIFVPIRSMLEPCDVVAIEFCCCYCCCCLASQECCLCLGIELIGTSSSLDSATTWESNPNFGGSFMCSWFEDLEAAVEIDDSPKLLLLSYGFPCNGGRPCTSTTTTTTTTNPSSIIM